MKFDMQDTNVIKGIAILCVIVAHFSADCGITIFSILGPVGVWLFLFISGYGLAKSAIAKGIKGYWIKKFKKVYIPYVIINIVIGIMFFYEINILTLAKSLLFVKTIKSEYWYIVIQFEWYFLFYIIWIIVSRKKIKVEKVIGILVIAQLIIFIRYKFSPIVIWTIMSFPLGVIMAIIREKHYKVYMKKEIITIVLILLSCMMKKIPYIETHTLGIADNTVEICITLLISYFVLLYLKNHIQRYRVLSNIFVCTGKISYELYLTHIAFRTIIQTSNLSFFTISKYVLLTIVVSLIIYLMQKIKIKVGV